MDGLLPCGTQIDVTEGDTEGDLIITLLQENKIVDRDRHLLPSGKSLSCMLLFPLGMADHREAVYLAVASGVGVRVAVELLFRIVNFEDNVVEADGLLACERLVAALADGDPDDKVWEFLVNICRS